MKSIGYITTTVGVLIVSTTYRGFVLTKLWKWFVVPQFHVAAISIPIALGLGMIVGYLTFHNVVKKDERPYSEKLIESTVHAFFTPTIALFYGWIVSKFI